jgi:hypothetical protein
MNTANEQLKLARAKRDVAAIKGFYIHLFVFALVMALLFFINMATGSVWWVQWPLLGWGIGVAAHGLAAFGRVQRWVASWEARKLQELKDRM